MKFRTNRSACIGVTAVTTLLLAIPTAWSRDDDHATYLRGEYGFTTLQNCVRTPFLPPTVAGFEPSTGKLLVNGEVAEAIGSGIMRFAKDGTVSVTARGTEVQENQISAGQIPVVPGTEYTCSGTYDLTSDNQLAVTLPACVVKSSSPSVTITVGPLEFEGYVGRNRGAGNLSMLKANIQTVAVSVAGNVVQKRERICIQSLSLNKLE
jgi:hypothetical protein